MDLIAIIMIVLLFSVFFPGMEIAFVCATHLRSEPERQASPFSSGILKMVSAIPARYIVTMLTGNNIVMAIYGIAFAELSAPLLVRLFPSTTLTFFVQIAAATIGLLFFAWFLPKALFRFLPNSLLKLFSLPAGFFYMAFYPVTRAIMFLVQILTGRAFDHQKATSKTSGIFCRTGLGHFVKESDPGTNKGKGEIDKEVKLFRNALDFSKVRLREIMVPRNEIAILDINTDIETLREKFVDTGFSRILIFEGNIDNIIGYVHSSAIFQQAKSIRPFLKNVLIVPETMAANKLLSKFIRDHRSIALVVDEFGGTAGLVTSEDILEEIFGEIEDEHDTTAIIEKQISEMEYIFSGRFDIDLINEKYHLNIPESEEYETLAGFIISHYQSIPKVNTVIRIQQFTFKILKVTSTKIELVHLTVTAT